MEVLRHLRPLGHLTRRRLAAVTLFAALALGTACATAGSGGALPLRAAGPQWPVKTREHVDLWLHAFALLSEDTAQVPLFDRGYRDRLTVLKNARNAYTDLDTERDALARALAAQPRMLEAQFLALYFGSWEEMGQAFEHFLRAEGDPRRSNNQEVQAIIYLLSQQFPSPADREFAQRLLRAVASERDRFHHQWWLEEQRARTAALAAADSLWQARWRPALQRYLNHTQQPTGDLIPTLALGGEGRAVPAGKTSSQYAVAWPATADSAAVLLFTFAHEAAGAVAQVAVNDNLTPVQQREGLGARYGAVALVRGGALLVERVDPALVEGYARYYLAQAGRPVPATNAYAALQAWFAMPEEMITSMRRQIDLAFGGI